MCIQPWNRTHRYCLCISIQYCSLLSSSNCIHPYIPDGGVLRFACDRFSGFITCEHCHIILTTYNNDSLQLFTCLVVVGLFVVVATFATVLDAVGVSEGHEAYEDDEHGDSNDTVATLTCSHIPDMPLSDNTKPVASDENEGYTGESGVICIVCISSS